VVPDGADAILPIERSIVKDGRVRADGPVRAGDGVRPRGADVGAGHAVLPAGTRLSPLAVAAIAGLGLATTRVARRPRVVVLTTGDELVPPGGSLRRGQIHESNSYLVAATLRGFGCDATVGGRVGDTPEETVDAFRAALAADLVVSSGGVSMGPRDHVRPALAELGVRELFWRVALQPGKPVWAGRTDAGGFVIGLPGNPLSALAGLHLLVRPLVGALLGEPDRAPQAAPLGDPVRRLSTRTRALPMRLEGGVLRSLGAELSHQLARAAEADVLALVEPGDGEIPAGEALPYVPLR
jgi:molybdopterin molybdotransferase